MLLHTVFAIGLRAVREAAEAQAYAEAARDRGATADEDRVIARRRLPAWANEKD